MPKANTSYSLFRFPFEGVIPVRRRTYVIAFCMLWVSIALLEFGQDYVNAVLNAQPFILTESLAYKLFWLLFIPLIITLDYAIRTAGRFASGILYAGYTALLVMVSTAVHLLLFSVLLYGVSNLVQFPPATLMQLIYEKLSTRLYIALGIYAALPAGYWLLSRWQARHQESTRELPSTLTVKNGRRSVLVNIDDIRWIASDGAYLELYTSARKHVMLGSLKTIIRSLPANFRRIHRSTIVNLNCIAELHSRGNGDYDVVMDDGRELRLSRTYAAPLKETLL